MKIETGAAEAHPTPLPLDTSGLPAVAPPTATAPSGPQQGGVLMDTSGVNFTAEAAAAMHAGMAADADRRGRYAAAMSPLGASATDEMALPVVPANAVPAEGSGLYPYSGDEPVV